jgi:hypothetical protein
MRSLIALLAAPLLFGQDGRFTTTLGTEAVDLQGGVLYRHGDGHADQAVSTRLRGGLNRWMSLYGEFGYSRLIAETIYQPVKIEAKGSIMDIIGGGELHWSGARVQPYLMGGIGTGRISGKSAIGPYKATVSNYHFASNLGAGMRIFAVRNAGFSVEVKTITIQDTGRYERYALGIFYQGRMGR